MTVMAMSEARDNADLIVECRDLRYLTDDMLTLDPTFNRGKFWTKWRPPLLVASDLDPKFGVAVADFTALPHADNSFDAVVFDPPYKLNGTSALASDAQYGIDGAYRSWQAKHQLIRAGIDEAVRVSRGVVLVKCQDQVCSGQVRWQTREFADHAETLGCRLVDQLHLRSYRGQPEGRRQVHARRNYSTLLVLIVARKGKG